ncbi:hypothetical protein W02_19210 [Nitrospira sp. KM1]|uniref:flagellar brake domain-containing protein n=1 Tax=Nitrospira sp. KM1 TaxID=1936990 RepID=UPI0013A73664|nr:flagellar brake protein [Nitrospira sp. KM1]BCA54781.1 hypothetical protein W02_19210 [Nitrospira sp. KM1]
MNEARHSKPSSFLSVGLPLKLSFQTHRGKVQVGSTLLGWKDHAWLVCEWPFHDQHEIVCTAGTPCLVSYVYEGKLIGYRTEVRESQVLPAPLLFLSFPSQVEEFHLRKDVRVQSHEPMLLMQVPDSSTSVSSASHGFIGGLLQDFSKSGCSVLIGRLPAGLGQGALVKLEFALPGVGHITNLTGVVKNLQEQEANYLLGIEFRFNEMEYIEFRGWGGSVQNAIQQWTAQKACDMLPIR